MPQKKTKSRLFKPLSITFFVMVVCMSLYETLKQFIIPGITIWESHIITITVSSIAATLAAYFLYRKFEKLNDVALHEIKERKQAQESLSKAFDDLEIRIENRTKELSESNRLLTEEVSNRKIIEADLRRSEERFSKIFHNAPVAISILSADELRFQMVNDCFIQMMEYDEKDQVHGKTYDELDIWINEEEIKSLLIPWISKGDTPLACESRIRSHLGEIKSILFSAEKIELNGKPCILGMFLDISDRKKTEKELIYAKEQAEEMDRFKTSLLAYISKEVSDPLKEMVLAAARLADKLERSEAKRIAMGINRDGDHLFKTINSILDLSRVEARRQELRPVLCDIAGEIRLSIDDLRKDARNKHIELEIIEKNKNVQAYIDKKFFSHVINNLVSNAIKYTFSGKITIEVDRINNQSRYMARFRVIDTGIGIKNELLPYIFDAMKPVESYLSEKNRNSSLGLPITQRMVNLMNGQISVESKEGNGSIFTVLFPAESEKRSQSNFEKKLTASYNRY